MDQCLGKHLLLQLVLIKSNEQLLAFSDRGSTEVSRRSEQDLRQIIITRVILLQINHRDFLTAGGPDLIHTTSQFDRAFSANLLLPRIHLLTNVYILLLQQLLGFFAALSAVAVIVPIHLRHRSLLTYKFALLQLP